MPLYLKDKLVSGTGAPGKSAYQTAVEAGYGGTETAFNEALKDVPGHIADTENPHGVTAAQAGAIASTEKGAASGVATLGADALLAAAQRPKAGGLYRDNGTTTVEESLADISTTLQKKVNPNLLDNWYFGNPVDQRGGYVVPPGTKYYIYGASTASGTTSAYVTVKKLTDQTAYFDIDGTEYVCAPKFCVRGYTGEGYGIDRWISHGGGLLLNDGYITFIGYGKNLDQIADKDVYKQLRGKTVTISVLGRGYFSIVSEDYANNYNAKYVNSGEFTICSFALTVRSDADRFVFHIQPQDENPCDIVAVKLELGSQQTLAHQDADGNWLLNEIPDYGEQLRRCQRYFIRIGVPAAQGNGAIGFVNCATDTLANTCINTPVTMRATPTATLKNIVLRKGITDFGVTGCNIFAITQNGIYMNFVSSGLTTGDTILIRTVNGGCIDFTADL